MKNEPKIIVKRKSFNEKYGEMSDSDILKEILYSQLIQETKLDKIRANTSELIWWLIIIPIILGVALGIFFE